MNNELLKQRTIYLKKDEKGVTGMRELVREVFDKEFAEVEAKAKAAEARGRIAAVVESVRNLMKNLKFTAETAMNAAGIAPADRPAILAAL